MVEFQVKTAKVEAKDQNEEKQPNFKLNYISRKQILPITLVAAIKYFLYFNGVTNFLDKKNYLESPCNIEHANNRYYAIT